MPVADPVAFVLALAREHREPEADVLLARDQHLTVKVLNGRVENVEQATALGLGIRVVREGRSGVAFTERLEPEALERAFRAAQENAPLLDPTEVVLARDLPAVADPETLGLFNPELEALGVEE
ncbi:MAG: TldD/PmbA family protein, partial [Candidatus Lambdaproteobacteria bacterium]|nr:TldD/PmbA family protein [Candidatus Lambdaproteobacteria bacterium]